jgi:GNAT superfamily N-acetyltransferase
VNYFGSPINAFIHTFAGQPLEDATGIPSRYTDFTVGLALPFLKRLPGMSGPPVVRIPRTAPSGLADAPAPTDVPAGVKRLPDTIAPPSAAERAPSVAASAVAGATQYTHEQAGLIRNWLGIAPERFRGRVGLDPPALEGTILDARGEPIGLISRSISRETGVAQHGALMLSPEFEGQGLGRDILRANIDYYRQLGLSRVDVNAALDRGGYVWARYGFVPTQEAWDALRPVLRAKVGEPSLNLAPAERQATLDLLESPDPRTIWHIADDRTPTVIDGQPLMFRDKPVPLGNHLLSGNGWEGSLDLKDQATLERFYNYVGSNR